MGLPRAVGADSEAVGRDLKAHGSGHLLPALHRRGTKDIGAKVIPRDLTSGRSLDRQAMVSGNRPATVRPLPYDLGTHVDLSCETGLAAARLNSALDVGGVHECRTIATLLAESNSFAGISGREP